MQTRQKTSKLSKKQTPTNYLSNLIKEKWEEYDLDLDSLISKETICTRYKRGNLEVERKGCPPILPDCVEKVIVDIVVTMSKIRNPLCVYEFVEFANSIVSKTEYQEMIIERKKTVIVTYLLKSAKSLGTVSGRGSENVIMMSLM
jgi:hypothetical protein